MFVKTCFTFMLQLLLISIIIVCSFANESNRQIKCFTLLAEENTKKEYNFSIIHVTATSDQDVIHYLWSTYKLPSLIVARTTKDTHVNINMKKLQSFQKGAIEFNKEPIAATGFTVTQLWQNSYSSDSADVNEISDIIPLSLDTFQWKNIGNGSLSCSNEFALINFVSSSEEEIFSKGGTFEIEFSVAGSEKSAAEYPHLIYTGNSTQIKAVFNNLYSNSSRVRYGMEMSVFAPMLKNCHNESCEPVVTKSVSDEYSPGIFKDMSLLPPCSHDSFLAWRPVAYLSNLPSVANSTDAKMTTKCSTFAVNVPESIAELFFYDQKNASVNAFNVTFGTKGDGFYPKTKYTMWSLMAGVGKSVGFKVSLTAIIFSSIGLGALFLFMVIGSIFVLVQKFRRKRDDERSLLTGNAINN